MTFKDLQNTSIKIRAAVWLETFAPRRLRKALKEVLLLLVPLIIILSIFFAEESHLSMEKLIGMSFAAIFLLLIIFMFDIFFYSMYFEGVRTTLPEFGFLGTESSSTHSHSRSHTPFEVLFIALHTNPEDVTLGFLNSIYGRIVFSRLNVDRFAVEHFLKSRALHIRGEQLKLPDDPPLAAYAGALYDADAEFSRFLLGYGFTRRAFVAVTEWVASMIETEKARLRWWSRDSLGRIRGVAKEWTEGETEHLKKYGKYLLPSSSSLGEELYGKRVNMLERVLLRSKDANALIIGNEKEEVFLVVDELARRISDGTVLSELEHKKLFLLNTEAFLSATDSKTDLEREIVNVLDEAEKLEHIIFVIPDFAAFVSKAESHGVDVAELLIPYFHSSHVQIVALCDKLSFIEGLERKTRLLSKFQKILLIENHKREAILRFLEEKVASIERKKQIFITYSALVAIAIGAEKYFSDNAAADKISKFFTELMEQMKQKQKRIVTERDIIELRARMPA